MVYLIVAAAVIAGGWVVYQVSETRRNLELGNVARRLGLNYCFGLPAELKEVLPRFRVVEKAMESGGEFQAGLSSITGAWRDRRIAFFDFEWVTLQHGRRRSWGGRSHPVRRIHRRSAVAVELGVGLQPVLIRPERLVDKALALVGYDDIDFSQLPEFSRAFYVNSPDRVAARRLVTPALARFFLDHVRVTVDIVGPWMLLHRDVHLAPGGIPDLMDLAGRLSELITREQRGHAGSR